MMKFFGLVTTTLPEEELAAQAAAAARAIRTPPPRPAPVGSDGQQFPAEGAAPVSGSSFENEASVAPAEGQEVNATEDVSEAVSQSEIPAEEAELIEAAAEASAISEATPQEPTPTDEVSPEESEE